MNTQEMTRRSALGAGVAAAATVALSATPASADSRHRRWELRQDGDDGWMLFVGGRMAPHELFHHRPEGGYSSCVLMYAGTDDPHELVRALRDAEGELYVL